MKVKTRKALAVILIQALLLAGLAFPGAAAAAPASRLVADKDSYAPGDAVQVRLVLDGFADGAAINSATFRLVYDPAAFALATGSVQADLADGSLPSSAKTASAVPGILTYQVTELSDKAVVNGSAVFTAAFKVKSDAPAGSKTFRVQGDNADLSTDMLDKEMNAYHVESASVAVTVMGGSTPADDAGSGTGGSGSTGEPSVQTILPDPLLTGGRAAYSLNGALKFSKTEETLHGVLNADASLEELDRAPDGTKALTLGVSAAGAVDFAVPGSLAEAALAKLGADGVITVASAGGSYTLPLAVLRANGGAETDAVSVIALKPISGANAGQLPAGYASVGDPVDFSVTITSPDGRTLGVKEFAPWYAERSLPLGTAAPDTNRTGIFRFDEAGDRLTFIPAMFGQAEDGTWQAVFRSSRNSLYTAAQKEAAFRDIAGNWARPVIEKLAAKGLVSGRWKGVFAPAGTVTRAEFASLLVNGLGLGGSGASVFADVKASAWYAEDVAAASRLGLVTGGGDVFRPDSPVTRAELAVMTQRAMKLAAPQLETPSAGLSGYEDAGRVPDWAKEALQALVGSGILNGRSAAVLDPSGKTTRAEAAVIVDRLLVKLGFINM